LGPFGTPGVSADNGPHGGVSSPTTDACAGCHRIHTAQTETLNVQTVPGLCLTCHDSTGADTNVVDGLYEAEPGRGLMGGGFINTMMDLDWDGVSSALAVTSTHTMDGSAGTAWGNGAIGSGHGLDGFSLNCTTCHNPHGKSATDGSPTYRILRSIPTGSGAPAGVDVPDEDPKYYGVESLENKYFGQYYQWELDDALSDWCSQCHTRYLAYADSALNHSGDPIFSYRHMTQGYSSDPEGCLRCHFINGQSSPPNPYEIDPSIIMNPRCQTCHVSHGTSASMGEYSGAVSWPDSSTSPNGDARSSLLRLNNRGVCAMCHADK
jgi:predicted CXXCH cytochrome family protein